YHWRKRLAQALSRIGIQALDPMRNFDLKVKLRGDMFVDSVVECDIQDLIDADCIIAYVPQGVEIIGTAMEICIMSRMLDKPVYVVTNRKKLSPWIKYHATCIFEDFRELLDWMGAT